MSQNFDELMDSLNVQDILDAEGISFRRASSGELNIRQCPWCQGSSSKVYLNERKLRGVCFHGSCGQRFTFFTFMRQHLETDSKGTFQVLERYGLENGFKPATDRDFAPAPLTPGDWKLPRSTPLPASNGHTLEYLLERKVLPETQRLFQLSYCHEGSYSYTDAYGNGRKMDFSQRVIIPVVDLDGSAQTFQGRDITGEAEKRYLFPPMLPGTGRFLYGAHLHQEKAHLVIGEGPFDTWAIHQSINGMAEFRDTGEIGSFGLSIGDSDEQGDDQLGRLRQLKRVNLKTLTFLWDAEKGALKRALDAGMKLRREGFAVRIGLLPEGKDPSDCSTEQVRVAIRDAIALNDQSYFQLSLRSPYKS